MLRLTNSACACHVNGPVLCGVGVDVEVVVVGVPVVKGEAQHGRQLVQDRRIDSQLLVETSFPLTICANSI